MGRPPNQRPLLALERVRFGGEPVVAVAADDEEWDIERSRRRYLSWVSQNAPADDLFRTRRNEWSLRYLCTRFRMN